MIPQGRNAVAIGRLDHAATAAATNAVLRNTYWLLGMTLVFSAITAAASVALALPSPGLIGTLVGYFGLLFLTTKLRNSNWGLLSTFALDGLHGLHARADRERLPRPAPVAGSSLRRRWPPRRWPSSAWPPTRARRVPSTCCASARSCSSASSLPSCSVLAAVFFAMPALSLAVSGLFVLLMSGLIVYQIQSIVAGGETNYIMATVTLFVSIFNLFTSLLQLFGFLGGEE